MAKGKSHIRIAQDVQKLIQANHRSAKTWQEVRDCVREYVRATPTTLNWVSGLVYRKRKRDAQVDEFTEYHKKYLLKLKKIFRKRQEKGMTSQVKSTLDFIQKTLDDPKKAVTG